MAMFTGAWAVGHSSLWIDSLKSTAIDENGIIIKAFGKVKAADNPAQMLGEL